MRVLHYGLILYQPFEITRGLREIGVDADYILWDDFGQEWLMHGWDTNLKMESIKPPFKKIKQHFKIGKFYKDVVSEYDVIHFHSHPTFKHGNYMVSTYRDLKFLKSLHKKVFVSFWGCDARKWNHEIQYPWSPCRMCGAYQRNCCNISSSRAISAARTYCDAIFASGDLCIDTDYIWANVAIDTTAYAPTEPLSQYRIAREPDDFVIYHSFGNSGKRLDVKGSHYISDTISRLQKDGYPIKYVFVDNVPNVDIKYIQGQADVVIDQLCAGWYGANAVECLSLGKPVISYLRQDILAKCPNENVPIINANPKQLKETLLHLMEHRDELSEIGRKSRAYATKYHDRKVVARHLLDYYTGEKLWKRQQ